MFTGQRKRNRAAWRALIDEWKTSGLSQAEFCRLNGHSIKQFSRWKLKLSQIGLALPESLQIPDESPFIQIPVNKPSRNSAPHSSDNAQVIQSGELTIRISVRDDCEIILAVRR